jgi:hypothetical protein
MDTSELITAAAAIAGAGDSSAATSRLILIDAPQ